MNTALKEKIVNVRSALESDPDGLVAGQVRAAASAPHTGVSLWDEFLAEANGGRFGSIDLWSTHELDANQFLAATIPDGGNSWLIVGQVVYEPLAVSRKSNEVILFSDAGPPRNFGGIDEFLNYYVFGRGYSETSSDAQQSEWWLTLRTVGLV